MKDDDFNILRVKLLILQGKKGEKDVKGVKRLYHYMYKHEKRGYM